MITTTVADTGYAPAVFDPELTLLTAADRRLLTRAKVAYLYCQEPCEVRKDNELVLVLETRNGRSGGGGRDIVRRGVDKQSC